jgi:hypothetical protein
MASLLCQVNNVHLVVVVLSAVDNFSIVEKVLQFTAINLKK